MSNISSEKVSSFMVEGFAYPLRDGAFPSREDMEHFSTFLRLKLGEEFDPAMIQRKQHRGQYNLIYTMFESLSGNHLNPLVYDNIVKVEDVLENKGGQKLY